MPMVSRRILLKQEAEPSNAGAATDLVHALVDEIGIAAVRRLLGAAGAALHVLVSAHAYEREGFNAIPAVLARLLSERLGIPFDTTVVQTNVVGHTGAGGYGRLARQPGRRPGRRRGRIDRQALFGEVEPIGGTTP